MSEDDVITLATVDLVSFVELVFGPSGMFVELEIVELALPDGVVDWDMFDCGVLPVVIGLTVVTPVVDTPVIDAPVTDAPVLVVEAISVLVILGVVVVVVVVAVVVAGGVVVVMEVVVVVTSSMVTEIMVLFESSICFPLRWQYFLLALEKSFI